MTGIVLSDGVKTLAEAIQAALAASTTAISVDERLASFAAVRHRVGPALYMGIEGGAIAAHPDGAAFLSKGWLANKTRCNVQALATARIGQALMRSGVGYLSFKGIALGQALYPEPTWRHCGDIDILVAAGRLARAADVLAQAGLSCQDAVFSLPSPVRRVALRILRDIPIDDLQLGQKIELHSRPMFSRSISNHLLAADPTFRPRLPARASETPVPAIGAGLAYYLLLHGAISGWTRLKWLADILRMMNRLEDPIRANIAALAEGAGTAKAVKAGLHLAVAAFPTIELGSLGAWLAEPTARNSIAQRVEAYARWLNAPSDTTPSPLHDRRASLRSTLLLVDSPWTKAMTLPPSGLATALRIVAKRMLPFAASDT